MYNTAARPLDVMLDNHIIVHNMHIMLVSVLCMIIGPDTFKKTIE